MTLKELYKETQSHYLYVDFRYYKKYKFLIWFLLLFNRNYIHCSIFRNEVCGLKNVVIVGLRFNGKNVRRRTSGFAKKYIMDNPNAHCIYCNDKLDENNATADHIIPITKGGNNSQVNLLVCCSKCNGDRSDMKFEKYYRIRNKNYIGRYIFI